MERYKQSILKEELRNEPRLRVKLFGNILSSPLILASGTLVEYASDIQPFLDAGAGAVVPRSTRKKMERTVHPSPHLYQSGKKGEEIMLNAEWTGADINYWKPHLKEIMESKRVIMSVSGRDIEGCVEVCKELDKYPSPMIEVNVSCAHSNNVHGFITRNGDHITKLVKNIKKAGVKTPIGIKLGHSDYIVNLAQIAKDAGADAIVAINTFGPLFNFSIEKGGVAKSVMGIQNAKGGMSGAPLFHIALTDVAEIRHKVDIPVIGCGGVRTAEHVVKMMMAGASAVQTYTAAHVKGLNAPSMFSETNEKLLKYLDDTQIDSISDVKDKALHLLSQETNLEPLIPCVDKEKCIGCNNCVSVCLPLAIDKTEHENAKGYVATIKPDDCVGCGHCVAICPTGALEQH